MNSSYNNIKKQRKTQKKERKTRTIKICIARINANNYKVVLSFTRRFKSNPGPAAPKQNHATRQSAKSSMVQDSNQDTNQKADMLTPTPT